MNQISKFLDLKTIPCPLNVVKCKLALEKLSFRDILVIDIDKGEPEVMVIKAIEQIGYNIQIIDQYETWLKLKITKEFFES